jgi:hypothetical protein
MQRVWQIGSGDAGRHYDDLFFGHDVMFMGPGDHGRFSLDVYKEMARSGRESKHNIDQVRRFAEEVQTGDFVLLRRGHRVKHIGIVHESGYDWKELFDDVFGWDLQHTHRVVWQEHLIDSLAELQKAGPLFGMRKRVPTFTRVRENAILDSVRPFFDSIKLRTLKPLPPDIPRPLSPHELGEALFARGLSNEAVDKVLQALDRAKRLHRWYNDFGVASNRPSEHEIVAHVVLPFFNALGWSEQLLAIEWNKIDLAAFSGTPTTSANCVLICEAKGQGQGLRDVINQAAEYSRKLQLNQCRVALVTDGFSAFLYTKEGGLGDWFGIPAGYLNMTRIRTESIIARLSGVDAITKLTPAGIMQIGGVGPRR